MPFNGKNVKELFDKRVKPENLKLGQKRMVNLSFSVKDERNGVVRDVRDLTRILHQSMDLALIPFDYFANSD